MRARGVTLAEVLIGGSLTLLVIAVAVMVFIPALRVWKRGQARSEVQQAVLIGQSWLRRDIEHAAPETIYWEAGGLRMVVQGRPLEHDATGASLWHEQAFYWLGSQGELHRQVVTFPSPPATAPPLPAPSRDPQARVIARNVYAFECGVTDEKVRVHLEADYQGQHFTVDTMSSTILKTEEE